MEHIVHDDSTKVKLTAEEAKGICKAGQAECCAFLACGRCGFECIRMSYPANGHIFARLDEGTMRAKGRGGWKGCAWEEKEVADEQEEKET